MPEFTIEDLPDSRMADARALLRQYFRSVGVDLSFQDVEGELREFPTMYSAPSGAFLVAVADGELVGCVGLRRLDEGICEMKRMFVVDEHKGKGIGRALAEALLARARSMGYRKIRLDTLKEMQAAQGLYLSLGFHPIGPYVYNPLSGSIFMEKELHSGRN